MTMLPRFKRTIVALAIVLMQGCASVQQISPQSVEDKVGQIRLGVTTMSDVERIFGTPHGNESRRWFYNISDTTFGVSEPTRGTLAAVLPVVAGTVATNTRALITIRFTDDGKVTSLEVERFFDLPFTSDYWYRVKDGAPNVLEFVVRAAEANDLRVEESYKSVGMLTVEDSTSNARMVVKLEDQTLHITSTNPHDRVTTEYRVFTKRKHAFINKISTADFLW